MGSNASSKDNAPAQPDFLEDKQAVQTSSEACDSTPNRSHTAARLYFACSGLRLPGDDSVPSAMLLLKEEKSPDSWALLGQTETVYKCKCPAFATPLKLEYYPEGGQRLRVEVQRADESYSITAVLGSAEFCLQDLAKKRTRSLVLELSDAASCPQGQLKVVCELAPATAAERFFRAEVSISGCETADYFFSFSRAHPADGSPAVDQLDVGTEVLSTLVRSGRKAVVYSSPHGSYAEKDQSYSWGTFEVPSSVLTLEDYKLPLMLQVFSVNQGSDTNTVLLTQELTVSSLLSQKHRFALTNDGKICGEFVISDACVKEKHSFLDYIGGGFALRLAVSFDFGVMNFPLKDPRSLHSSRLLLNPHAHTVKTLATAVLQYDPTKRIAALGMSARVPGVGVSHCFALNGNIMSPEVEGLKGLLEAYVHARDHVGFSGPSKFSEVIKYCVDAVEDFYAKEAFAVKKKYFVLMMTVSFTPADTDETKEQLARASSLPMSIVVVGVKDNTCLPLAELFHPTLPAYQYSRTLAVQYVPYDTIKSNAQLATERVILGIQRQFVEYAFANDVNPGNEIDNGTVFAENPAADSTAAKQKAESPTAKSPCTLGRESIATLIQSKDCGGIYDNLLARIKCEIENHKSQVIKLDIEEEDEKACLMESTGAFGFAGRKKPQTEKPKDAAVTEKEGDVAACKVNTDCGETLLHLKSSSVGSNVRSTFNNGPGGNADTEAKHDEKGDQPVSEQAVTIQIVEKPECQKETERNLNERGESKPAPEKPKEDEVTFEMVEPLLRRGFPVRKLVQMKRLRNNRKFKNVLQRNNGPEAVPPQKP